MHPDLDDLGYHCRDYFLNHWDRYENHPRGELAHATHLYGAGTYDAEHGERQRVRVTLATAIPRPVVEHATFHTWILVRSTSTPGRRTHMRWLTPTRVRCSTG